jgi:preprotein translocase YajC subunit
MIAANLMGSPWLIGQASDETTVNPLVAWLPFILVGAALYFLAIRPQKKRQQAVRDFQSNLNVGDEVRTAGGIIGVVASISDQEVMVDVGGLTLKFARGAIAARAGGEPE